MKFVLLFIAIATSVLTERIETLTAGEPECITVHALETEVGDEIPNGFSPVLTFHLGPVADENRVTFYSVDVSGGSIAKWDSTFPIDSIIVKGGTGGAYVYRYPTPVKRDDAMMRTTWTGRRRAAIESIHICFQYNLWARILGGMYPTLVSFRT